MISNIVCVQIPLISTNGKTVCNFMVVPSSKIVKGSNA